MTTSQGNGYGTQSYIPYAPLYISLAGNLLGLHYLQDYTPAPNGINIKVLTDLVMFFQLLLMGAVGALLRTTE